MTATRVRADERSARIVADYQAGLSGPAVAAAHQVSRTTVYRKLDEAGIPRRQQPAGAPGAARAPRERQEHAGQVARAVEMAQAGATVGAIARAIRRHPATVKKWLARSEMQASRRSMTPEEREAAREDMRALRARALTLKRIQAQTGHGWKTVKELLGEPVARRGVR